ncbi:MAG: tyrosine-type recombinase/integrase [Deltaproteobacteria bacterium]|nr:tyrosine-type recombinase/integrase [Deltaproteobacteria bacterium]
MASCIPAIASWQYSALPKFLQPDQVQMVLSQCDRRTAQGRRNYAILLLLARLGLRACEIVSLTLDDIHWQADEIRIQEKGNRSECFHRMSDGPLLITSERIGRLVPPDVFSFA